jgi:DNA-binding response OmpR family regulator
MPGTRPGHDAPILVVDDEDDIRLLVREALEREGHETVEAGDGKAALRRLHELHPRLVVLDVMMPELDGWQTLERIRDVSNVPVILLTARALEWERTRGLRAGADDYMTKPFSPMELAARVDALLRRAGSRENDRPGSYDDGFVRIDFAQRQVTVSGAPVSLTPLEYRLLAAFTENHEQVLDRDQLLKMAWGSRNAVFPDQVKVYVGYLRRKLGARADGTSPIETIRGFGYIYRAGSGGPGVQAT